MRTSGMGRKIGWVAGLVAVAMWGGGATAHAEEGADFAIKGDPAKGAVAYKTYCVTCHGAAGRGDGPAAVALNPKPKDLSNAEAMGKISDHEIYLVIRDGGPAVGLSPMMTAWKAVLQTDQAVHDVSAYVRQLATAAPPK